MYMYVHIHVHVFVRLMESMLHVHVHVYGVLLFFVPGTLQLHVFIFQLESKKINDDIYTHHVHVHVQCIW